MSKSSPVYREAGNDPPRLGLRISGWIALVLELPIALFGSLTPPNEYQATLGINALDCDGPFGVYLFAVPALILYGTSLILNGLRWRGRANLVVALLSACICAALVVNVGRAMAEDSEQAEACQSR